MKIISVTNADFSEVEIVVEDSKVVKMANILESSPVVQSFYVKGLNLPDQQKHYGHHTFKKWMSPIQQ